MSSNVKKRIFLYHCSVVHNKQESCCVGEGTGMQVVTLALLHIALNTCLAVMYDYLTLPYTNQTIGLFLSNMIYSDRSCPESQREGLSGPAIGELFAEESGDSQLWSAYKVYTTAPLQQW